MDGLTIKQAWLVPISALPEVASLKKGKYVLTPSRSAILKDKYVSFRVETAQELVGQTRDGAPSGRSVGRRRLMMQSSGVKVHLAIGYTDMRKGLDGLAMLVQSVLKLNPFSRHLFAFRGRKANLVKVLNWGDTGLCLFSKRLEEGRFEWPTSGQAGDTVKLIGDIEKAHAKQVISNHFIAVSSTSHRTGSRMIFS